MTIENNLQMLDRTRTEELQQEMRDRDNWHYWPCHFSNRKDHSDSRTHACHIRLWFMTLMCVDWCPIQQIYILTLTLISMFAELYYTTISKRSDRKITLELSTSGDCTSGNISLFHWTIDKIICSACAKERSQADDIVPTAVQSFNYRILH